jgi:hypothetical protein
LLSGDARQEIHANDAKNRKNFTIFLSEIRAARWASVKKRDSTELKIRPGARRFEREIRPGGRNHQRKIAEKPAFREGALCPMRVPWR